MQIIGFSWVLWKLLSDNKGRISHHLVADMMGTSPLSSRLVFNYLWCLRCLSFENECPSSCYWGWLFRGALVYTLIIVSWLQCRSFRLLVQILYSPGTNFLASVSDLWAFTEQIHETDLYGVLLWALGLHLHSCRHCLGI